MFLKNRIKIAILIFVSAALLSTAYSAQNYHGNIKSKVFHKSSCRYYNCKNCVKVFSSRTIAVNAGFRPCKICKP